MKPIKWDGQKITQPGIYSGIPIDLYHGDICDGPSVSSSGLGKIVDESPADYWATSYMNPEREDDEDAADESSALLLGRAVHHLILGEKNFKSAFVIQPQTYTSEKDGEKPWSNNAKVCKEWHAEQRRAGRAVLTKSDAETIIGMAKSVGRDEMVQAGILKGLIEHSIFWKDKKTGIWLKARPDNIPAYAIAEGGRSADISDLKTIINVQWKTIDKAIEDRGYYRQAALNRLGLREVGGIDVSSFTLVFVGKKKPWSTRPIILKPGSLDKGDEVSRVGLDVMARCLADKAWPGPGRGPARDIAEYAELSEWAVNRIDARLQRLKDTFAIK